MTSLINDLRAVLHAGGDADAVRRVLDEHGVRTERERARVLAEARRVARSRAAGRDKT